MKYKLVSVPDDDPEGVTAEDLVLVHGTLLEVAELIERAKVPPRTLLDGLPLLRKLRAWLGSVRS